MSKKAANSAASIGVYLIGVVKTNTKGFCKATTEGLTKDWPGGSYIVLSRNPMVPGESPLLDIGYKYNSQKFRSFVATEWAGRTTLGIHYLSKYLDQFSNVSMRPAARILLMSNFFGLVDEVYSHNKKRQSDLALDHFWVMQCCWLRLCTNASMGMKITNC